MGNNKCVVYVQRIINNSPESLYRRLRVNCPLLYKHTDGVTSYQGFDVSDNNPTHPIAEVILVDDIPVQIRYLAERPYWHSDVQFGGF